MIYKIYTYQYEANKYLYGLCKGHQQYSIYSQLLVTIHTHYIPIKLFAPIISLSNTIYSHYTLCTTLLHMGTHCCTPSISRFLYGASLNDAIWYKANPKPPYEQQ